MNSSIMVFIECAVRWDFKGFYLQILSLSYPPPPQILTTELFHLISSANHPVLWSIVHCHTACTSQWFETIIY